MLQKDFKEKFEAIPTILFVQDLVSRHGKLKLYENAFM